jgi:hypothetical protein
MIIVEGQFQNFDNSELLNFVDPAALEEAKKTDPHPTLKAFVIAHEGESKSHWVGIGERAIKWLKNAVGKVYDKLKIGTPVFSGHNEDNSTDGRRQIGAVIGKFQNMQNGINRIISIIQIYNPFKNKDYNIASFEGEMKMPTSLDYEVGENDLKGISGIALAVKSLGVKPAFANAEIVGKLQMLENGGIKVTLSEIMKEIHDQKIKVLDLFDIKDLLELSEIKSAIDTAESKANNQESAFKRLTAEKEGWKTEKTDLQKTIDDLNIKLKNNESSGIFDTVLNERKIEDEPMKKFIVLKKSEFKITDNNVEIKPEIDKFIDKKIEDYKAEKEIFNPTKKEDDKEKDTEEIGSEYFPKR